MIAVYLEPPKDLSRAMTRVARAMEKYAPLRTIEVVRHRTDADLEVLHVIGYPETVARVEELKQQGKKYAIIQYCIRSTQEPNTDKWMDIWAGAEWVWSYYDLVALAYEDKVKCRFNNFYHAPLGIDEEFTRDIPAMAHKVYGLTTSGYVAESECVDLAIEATKQAKLNHFHLGPKISSEPHVTYSLGVNDRLLASIYRRCAMVSGLRRVEGFELPVIEGMACGARPIVFDRRHYREWFGAFATFIPETDDNAQIVENIHTALKFYNPVSDVERFQVIEYFDWKRILSPLWN